MPIKTPLTREHIQKAYIAVTMDEDLDTAPPLEKRRCIANRPAHPKPSPVHLKQSTATAANTSTTGAPTVAKKHRISYKKNSRSGPNVLSAATTATTTTTASSVKCMPRTRSILTQQMDGAMFTDSDDDDSDSIPDDLDALYALAKSSTPHSSTTPTRPHHRRRNYNHSHQLDGSTKNTDDDDEDNLGR